jgi:hypothetical protein
MAELEDNPKFDVKATDLKLCHKVLQFDHYVAPQIKLLRFAYHCHDKFCPICQKKSANTREMKMHDPLTELAEKYDLYHAVFTSDNAKGNLPPWTYRPNDKRPSLENSIQAMKRSFASLNEYLKGHHHLKGMDFKKYGYGGAIRHLEITWKADQEYHPHYHVLMALKKGIVIPGRHLTRFSHSSDGRINYFDDFEVLLQKVWWLLMTGRKLTREAIEAVDLSPKSGQGFDVYCEPIKNGGWHQVFKYIVKPDKAVPMPFNVFSDLYRALDGVRAFQGYGAFLGLVKDEDIDESNIEGFEISIVGELNKTGMPVAVCESPNDIVDNIKAGRSIYLSFRKVREFLRKLGRGEFENLPIVFPARSAESDSGGVPALPHGKQMTMNLPHFDNLESFLIALDGMRAVKPKKHAETLSASPAGGELDF